MVAAEAEWDDIGEINDLVISQDGDVMAVIVGVGGFLGIGEKDVALTMDQIHVMREADSPQDIFLVVRSSSEALKAAPSFKRQMTRSKTEMGSSQKPMALVAPKVEREGYARSDRSGLTAEMLTDARVYGVNGEDVGEISSLLLDSNGAIDRAVIDVGGFLGIGEKPVAVSFDELTVLRKENGDEVQIFIESSKEALEALPAYEK
ncbi:PRC-barrel domain-containing protein [Nitratireductor aquibiodomus]|uniref:PRC-barrel domain-containing protein n=1 Tax=Nitratireductor aquibiodomus TaxID=204799 RepID=UPI0004683003|nr:PRC-barrel domain-containing protein [Nitratireductor aquibiodomus]